MTDELTKALLEEDVASQRALAEALHASVVQRIPLVRALVETGALPAEALARVLARSDAPVVQRVVPAAELVAALPPGLCERLQVVPVRRDAITGTVDVVMADPADAHAASEIAFHLGAPVRVLRAPLQALDEGLRRAAGIASRPPAASPPLAPVPMDAPPPPTPRAASPRPRLVVAEDDDDRRSSLPAPPRGTHSMPPSPAAAIAASARRSRDTPPWGTQIAKPAAGSEPPKSSTGSEIPIPLTRRTFSAVSGGTQRPPPLVDPAASPLGEGYPVDPESLRAVVEVNERVHGAIPSPPRVPEPESVEPAPSTERDDGLGALAAELPELRAAVREARTRDEVLERLLAGAERVAERVALFVVRRGGYLGWTCNAAFARKEELTSVLLPLDADNVFDRTVQSGLALGPLPRDAAHDALWKVMRHATADVALVPVRVQDKAAVIVLADELVDTMIGTRHLEELAAAAGDAFARILRERA